MMHNFRLQFQLHLLFRYLFEGFHKFSQLDSQNLTSSGDPWYEPFPGALYLAPRPAIISKTSSARKSETDAGRDA